MNGEHPGVLSSATLESAAVLRDRFAKAELFRHVVIENFFEERFARTLLEQFPGSPAPPPGASKAVLSDLPALGEAYKRVHAYFRSAPFLQWLGEVTGIADLRYDDDNYGGGTHENFDGRDLRPHVDFNIHPVTKLHRRINLIVYLNENWDPQWGGSIALHSDPRDPGARVIEYAPDFNRCIIFETNERSWHGFDRIALPASQKHRTRKSLSIYFYSLDRPEEEIHPEHTTFFVPRPLPSRLSAGHTLSPEDERELGELMAHRDRLIALYQREQGKRESGTAEAARLRIALAQAQAQAGISLPVFGYVRTSSRRSGYADGWASNELRLEIQATRNVRAFSCRVRIPDGMPDDAEIAIHCDGRFVASRRVQPGVADLSGALEVPQQQTAEIRIACTHTVNHKRLGLSADERDLGFFLEEIVFEHEAAAAAPAGALLRESPPRHICFLGDCQVGAFKNVLMRDAADRGAGVLGTAYWQTWFRARDFFSNGRFDAFVTRMLWETRCIKQTPEDGQAIFEPLRYRGAGGREFAAQFRVRQAEKQPVLVISCGVVDACDIEDELCARGVPPDEQEDETLDVKELLATIVARCMPLFKGICALRDAGVTRLCLLSVAPPSLPEHRDEYRPFTLRYATRAAFQKVYAQFCAEENIEFLDTWPDFAPDGKRDERYFQDEQHLSALGAETLLARIHAVVSGRESSDGLRP